jgi:hypothetical protein
MSSLLEPGGPVCFFDLHQLMGNCCKHAAMMQMSMHYDLCVAASPLP